MELDVKDTNKKRHAYLHTRYDNNKYVFVELYPLPNNVDTPAISKHTFIIPYDEPCGSLQVCARKYMSTLSSKMALFFFVDASTKTAKNIHIALDGTMLMSTLQAQYVKEDGFVHIFYSAENTFG